MNIKKPKAKYPTAMLIDDNEIDNFINQKMIEGHNYAERILIHTSSKSALEYLQNLQRDKNLDSDLIPNIIFLDINMPIMDGFQFVEEYSKLEDRTKKHGKIVLLTTSVNPADEEKSKTIKYIIGFLNKPLTKKNLAEL